MYTCRTPPVPARLPSDLVREVHDHPAARLAETGPFSEATLASALEAFHTLAEHREYWRVLTRAMLDGELRDVLASDHPGARRMVDTLAAVPIGRAHV